MQIQIQSRICHCIYNTFTNPLMRVYLHNIKLKVKYSTENPVLMFLLQIQNKYAYSLKQQKESSHYLKKGKKI